MEKQKELFGKFKKNKIDNLSSIKGGILSTATKTTLCITQESTFDADVNTTAENTSAEDCG